MFGKRIHAKTAFDWGMEGNPVWETVAPDGFRNLSADAKNGCGRLALLHEDSEVVYKVDLNRRQTSLGNEQEYLVARYLHRKYPSGQVGSHCRLPKVGLFSFKHNSQPWVVVSMQYIPGEQGGPVADKMRSIRSLGLSDMHRGNYVVDENGMAWPIDLGNRLDDDDFFSPYR